jgi:hypothetical protein
VLGAALSLAVIGCGSDDAASGGSGGGGGSGGLPAECVSLVEACLVNQQTCVAPDGNPECAPCASGHYASAEGCLPIGGSALSHEFPELTTAAGEEIVGTCRSWTLGNDTELWVNAVELEQNESSHHSNWMFVPDTEYPGPDGFWPCKERDYDQLSAALAGGVLYAQSTQAIREVQKFPEGVVVRIPPRARVISDVHILNVTPGPVTGHAKLTIYSIAEADVTIKLTPFHVTYDTLAIPPHATSRFSGVCELDSHFQSLVGAPFAPKVHYILPHTHALGTRFFLEVDGGPNHGQKIIDVEGFNGEARGRQYVPALDLAGATGLRFGCEFVNPRGEEVNWGFGDQEMCEALGFIESPVVFESRIYEANPDGMDGDIHLFTGPCSTLALPWGPDKTDG